MVLYENKDAPLFRRKISAPQEPPHFQSTRITTAGTGSPFSWNQRMQYFDHFSIVLFYYLKTVLHN